MENIFTFKIGGSAGQGIKSMGLIFAKVATRSGYHVYNYSEYPSLIRGGHNVVAVNFSLQEVTAPKKSTDFLVALNQETINRHSSELAPGSVVLFESETTMDLSALDKSVNLFPIPLSKLGRYPNSVAMGATIALLGGSLEILNNLVTEEYSDETNLGAVKAGYDYALANFPQKIVNVLSVQNNVTTKIVVSGNDAIAMGAIAAGMQFAAVYPMTPINQIINVLAANQEKYGYIFKQPEDEISGINMAIGASFAGSRAMVATSGGGFCLMTEGYGLAAMTEIPLVIVEGMRPGPATGLPTWNEQGDLNFILHAHQGDFPRIVLAAGDATEAFYLTMQAFNLADKYQTPVILLVDKNICESDQSVETFNFKKIPYYHPERLLPGTGHHIFANSDEHDVEGYSTEEADQRHTQMERRMKKLETCAKEDMAEPELFGPQEAPTTIVSWGSNKGAILEALKSLPDVNYLHMTWFSPFPAEAVIQRLSTSKKIISVEANYSGQMTGLIREKTGIEIKDTLFKYDGRPIYSEEIVNKIKSL